MNTLHSSLLRKIFSLVAGILFFSGLIALSHSTLASGLTYVKIGEQFSAELENKPAKAKVEWVLSSTGDIIETSHKDKFSYTFGSIGNFTLRATTEDQDKNRKTTTFDVMAVSKIPNFQKLESQIKTLPEQNDGVIHLSGDEATVVFAFTESSGEIKKYELDTDIFSDGDGNGEISDDVDNKNDPSFLTGGTFSHTYKNTGLPARARLRVTDSDGNTDESFVMILFPENSETGESKSPPSPSPEEQQVFIQNNSANTANSGDTPENSGTSTLPSGATLLDPVLFASRSEILEGQTATFEVYSAPENAKYSWDFDGDGLFEIEEGTETKVTYKFADSGHYTVEVWIIEAGKEAVIKKREIIVGENYRAEIETFDPVAHFSPEISGNQVLFKSSQSQADENMFNTDLSYSWDFGDGFKTQGPNPTHIYEKTGTYTISLSVEDSLERVNTISQEINIEEVNTEFSADQHGGKDGAQNTEESNPENSGGVIKVTEKDLTDTQTEGSNEEQNTEESNPGNSEKNSGSYAWIWWILGILIFIPLLLLIPLLKMKIDDPDKEFSVIFTEFFSKKKKTITPDQEKRENIENKQNIGILEEEKNETPEKNTDQTAGEENIFSGDVLEHKDSEESKNESEAETPDWMKNYDEEQKNESSTEVTDNTPIAIPENTNTVTTHEPSPLESESEENIPDWLKGGDSPLNDDLPDEPTLENIPESTPENLSVSENIIQNETKEETAEVEEDIPDWLKGDDESTSPEISPEIVPEQTEETPENSESTEIEDSPFSDFDHPDWLNEIKEEEDNEEPDEEETQNLAIETPEKNSLEAIDDDLPDWLKGENETQTEEVQEKVLEETPKKKKRRRRKKKKSSEQQSSEISEQNIPENSSNLENTGETLQETSLVNSADDDLPDWLKGDDEIISPEISPGNSENNTEEVQEEVEEKVLEETPKKKKRRRKKKKKSSEQQTSEISEQILAKDAKIPRQEDTSEIPEWLKG